jgi:Ni,Fe-hydrogenase I small subunit
MNEYKFIRDGQNEKGRVRELENMLITERSRAETERKVLIEKSNSIVEELKNKLIQCEMNEKLMIQQYEEKLRMYHNELELQENMKKSQIVVSEGKVSASAQEIHRLSEENKYLKQCLEA